MIEIIAQMAKAREALVFELNPVPLCLSAVVNEKGCFSYIQMKKHPCIYIIRNTNTNIVTRDKYVMLHNNDQCLSSLLPPFNLSITGDAQIVT